MSFYVTNPRSPRPPGVGAGQDPKPLPRPWMSLLSKSDLASPGTSVNIYSIYGSQEAVLVEEAPTRAFPASAGVAPVVLAQGAGILIPFLIKDLVSPLLVFSVCQTTLSSPPPPNPSPNEPRG